MPMQSEEVECKFACHWSCHFLRILCLVEQIEVGVEVKSELNLNKSLKLPEIQAIRILHARSASWSDASQRTSKGAGDGTNEPTQERVLASGSGRWNRWNRPIDLDLNRQGDVCSPNY